MHHLDKPFGASVPNLKLREDMHLFELKNISASYGAVPALRSISLSVDAGEMISIVGSNGAGKTTVCKVISGILPASDGEVFFDGEDIINTPSYKRVDLGIVQCPEGRHLFPDMTVAENLRMGAFCARARDKMNDNITYVYELFPRLFERKGQDARTLSGGEQQMLAIGRAIMAVPKLLILDEPSLGLSPVNVQLIFEKLDVIRASGTTIILVEQNVEKALRKSSRGYVLENGQVIIEDNCKNLLTNDRLRKAYLGI